MEKVSTKLFASSGAGVFLSMTMGRLWTGVNSGLQTPMVWSLDVLGTNLFAGTMEMGFIFYKQRKQLGLD